MLLLILSQVSTKCTIHSNHWNSCYCQPTKDLNDMEWRGEGSLGSTDLSKIQDDICDQPLRINKQSWNLNTILDTRISIFCPFSQNVISLALPVLEWRHFEDFEEKDQSATKLMSNKVVCRTSWATPGLVNITLLHPNNVISEGCKYPSPLQAQQRVTWLLPCWHWSLKCTAQNCWSRTSYSCWVGNLCVYWMLQDWGEISICVDKNSSKM